MPRAMTPLSTLTVLTLCATALAAPRERPVAHQEPDDSERPEAPPIVEPGWVVLSADLSPIAAKVISRIDAHQIVLAGIDQTPQTRPLSQTRAVVSEAWYDAARAAVTSPQPAFATPPSEGLLTLTDGSRFIGQARASTEPDTIVWVTPLLGEFRIKIDLISSLVTSDAQLSGTPPGPAARADRVVLNNGDTLFGLIASITPDSGSSTDLAITIEPQTGPGAPKQSARTIPLSRVRELSLVNPPSKAPPARVYFTDGSIAPVTTIDLSPQQALAITYPPGIGHASLSRVALAGNVIAITFPGPALTPLSALPVARQQPEAGRPWSLPVSVLAASTFAEPLGAADVLIPGPMTVNWTLPPKSARMAGALVLPENCRAWGDCTVTISTAANAAPLLTKRLNADQPLADFNIPLPTGARELQITVASGERGPIQNQVILRRALIQSE